MTSGYGRPSAPSHSSRSRTSGSGALMRPTLRRRAGRRNRSTRAGPDYEPDVGTGSIRTRVRSLPQRSYLMMPSTSANSVQSRPTPTLAPGWTRVPTWRTRMLPALACWPPYILTPRRCPWLSRPLRLLPCPFLCAISADLRHLDGGDALPVPAAAPVVLAALLLVDEDLSVAALGEDLPAHDGALDQRRADADLCIGVVAAREQHLGELDGRADVAGELLDAQRGARRHAILLSPGADDGEIHDWSGTTGLPRRADVCT